MTRPRIALLVALTLAAGCMVDLNTFELCERDPESCGEAAPALSATCAPTGPIEVQIGTGETAFEALAPGAQLKLYEGTPVQAADTFHVFLGVRVVNPGVTGGHYKAFFRAFEPDPDDPGQLRLSVVQTSLAASLRQEASGALSRGGIRVLVKGQPQRVDVRVVGPCGREATALHDVAEPAP